MSKTIWIVLGVVLIAVGGYFALQQPTEETSLNTDTGGDNLAGGTMPVGTEGDWSDTPMEEQNSKPQGKKMAFGELVKLGESYECTVNQYIGDNVSKGTAYISGGLIRGEFNTQTQGMNISTSLIVRDGYTYSWTSMAPNMGFKAKVLSSGEANPNQGASGTYSWNADQIGDYDCQPWKPEMTKFDIPTNIKFQEIN